ATQPPPRQGGHGGSLKRENRDPTCHSAGHHRSCPHGQGGGFFRGAGSLGRLSTFAAMGMDSLDERKRALRALVQARLPRPGSPEHVSDSVAAQERLASSPLVSGARVVALYRALPSECGTAALASALQAAGKEICYPL